jgi:Na+-transporting NADH:ubiquinone oxidoreductase subunit NqrB
LAEKNVKISKIFDWYKADFGEITTFLSKYSTVKVAKDAKIEYVEYDWSLNE